MLTLLYLGKKTGELLREICDMSVNSRKILRKYEDESKEDVEKFNSKRVRRHQLRRRIHALDRSAEKLTAAQASVQKQFEGLVDAFMEKKHRLYELLALNRVFEEVNEIEVSAQYL